MNSSLKKAIEDVKAINNLARGGNINMSSPVELCRLCEYLNKRWSSLDGLIPKHSVSFEDDQVYTFIRFHEKDSDNCFSGVIISSYFYLQEGRHRYNFVAIRYNDEDEGCSVHFHVEDKIGQAVFNYRDMPTTSLEEITKLLESVPVG